MRFEHSSNKELICPYCDYKFVDLPDLNDLFADQMTEEWEYNCECNREDLGPARINCTECHKMFDVSYNYDYKWWSSKAVDCKPQAHKWGNELVSFNSKYSDDGICRYYGCTKCSANLYIDHLNADGSVPTPKEYKKLKRKKNREQWLKDHPEEGSLPDSKDVTIYVSEYDEVSFHADIKDRQGNNKLWLGALKVMKSIGFNIGQLSQYQKGGHFSSLASGNRYCTWKDLECGAELTRQGIKFEFYQNIVLEDGEKHGRGKYSYNKLKLMPYLIKKRMEYTFLKLREYFETHPNVNIVKYIPKHLRDNGHGIGRDWHCYPTIEHLKGADAVAHIRRYCLSKGDSGRAKDYLSVNSGREVKDQDGNITEDGALKYTYVKNRLHRGRIYYRCGCYSFFVLNDNSYILKEVYKTFNKKEDMPRRFVSLEKCRKKLEKILSEKIKEQDFIRCYKIKKKLDVILNDT